MAHFNPLTRRRLLQLGGLSGLALTAGGALLMRGGGEGHYRGLVPGAVPSVLSVKELGVFAAFCARVCPMPSATQPGPAVLRVAERLDRELTFHTPQLQRDVKSLLLVLEHGGALHGVLTRFTRLAADAQDAALTRMATAGLEVERQAVSNLKLMALFFYYCDSRTWQGIHYDGPLQPRKAPEADSRVEP
jgi:hypothetical protein